MLHRRPGNAENGRLISTVLHKRMIERLSEDVLRVRR
jgi:hypothetical protein